MRKQENRLTQKVRKEQKYIEKDARFFAKYGIHIHDVKKKDETVGLKHIFKFKSYFKGEGWWLLLVGVLVVLNMAINIVAPLLLNWGIDELTLSNFDMALIILAVYGFSSVFCEVFYFGYNAILTYVFNRVIFRMRQKLSENILITKTSKFDVTSSGDILNRVANDPERFADTISMILERGSWTIIRISRLVTFFVLSWVFGLYALIAGLIVCIVPIIISKKGVGPARLRDSKIEDNFQSLSNEMVKGVRDIKSLNLNKFFMRSFRAQLIFNRNSNNNLSMMRNGMWTSRNMLAFFFSALGYVLGIVMVTQDMMTVSALLTIMMYDWGVYNAFGDISHIYDDLISMEVRAKRMYEILDDKTYPKETFGERVLNNVYGDIEFKNVGFKYDESVVFDNLNFKINAGECVGLVGRSGEGKSTILSLMPRLYDVTDGEILLDGVDIRRLTRDSLRDTVSIVSQSPYIFNVSIKENLLYAKPDATEQEIIEACEKAQIHDFIMSKPEKYDTKVGEGGVVLSGGQKQRLAIARAFLKGSKILLLDEATSALDNESQGKVKEAINNLKGQCTILIVAHRLSTVMDCDKIMVLSNHKIIAEGTHEELMQTCPNYQELYRQDDEKN